MGVWTYTVIGAQAPERQPRHVNATLIRALIEAQYLQSPFLVAEGADVDEIEGWQLFKEVRETQKYRMDEGELVTLQLDYRILYLGDDAEVAITHYLQATGGTTVVFAATALVLVERELLSAISWYLESIALPYPRFISSLAPCVEQVMGWIRSPNEITDDNVLEPDWSEIGPMYDYFRIDGHTKYRPTLEELVESAYGKALRHHWGALVGGCRFS